MLENLNLEKGQEVTINVPFTYTIGEEGPISGEILETVAHCVAEAQAELERGIINPSFVVE